MDLTLDTGEVVLLKRVLTSYLGDLRMEICGTDRMDFRERLKDEERFIKRVIGDLNAESVE